MWGPFQYVLALCVVLAAVALVAVIVALEQSDEVASAREAAKRAESECDRLRRELSEVHERLGGSVTLFHRSRLKANPAVQSASHTHPLSSVL